MERYVDTGTPAADHVIKLLDAAKITQAVIQACDLQVFDELQKAKEAPTPGDLAKSKGWDPEGLRRLLDMMVAVKLVSKSQNYKAEDVYVNTESGQLLIKDGPPALHGYAMMVNEGSLCQFAETIRKGPSSETTGCGESCSDDWADVSFTPELMVSLYNTFESIAKPYAEKILKAVDLSKYKTAVDLAGGSGVFSYALLRAYPEMKVVLAELPNVIPVIEEHCISKNKDPCLSTLPIDFSTDTLPSADLYLLANIVHDLKPQKCKDLLNKVHNALNTDGAIVIIEQLMNDDNVGPPRANALDLSFYDPTQEMLSGKRLAARLEECNFGVLDIVKTQECCMNDLMYAVKK